MEKALVIENESDRNIVEIQVDRNIDKNTERWKYRKIDKQKNRNTDRKIEIYKRRQTEI